jgi:ubiquinone/menaquinone biosynthesis C-methylase UbiE
MVGVLKQKPTHGVPVETVLGEIFEYKQQDIDFAFSCMAFHHIPDIDAALKHLYSVCKSGATVVVGDLLTEDGSFHRFEPIPHKGFDLNELSNLFLQAGFVVELAMPYNNMKRERTPGVITEYTQFILIARKA